MEHATVLVYKAGVKKGNSIFCPTCYVDCGKRAITDRNGMFTTQGVVSMLVALDGCQPTFVNKVDPSLGTPIAATLARRKRAGDVKRLFRGRVQDSRGLAVRDAIVKPIGILLDDKTGVSRYGAIEGLESVAITNKNGEFQLAYSKTGLKIVISVEARGMASAFDVIPSGTEVHVITVTDGVVVRGRVVENGKPLGNAEVGLIACPRAGFGAVIRIPYPYRVRTPSLEICGIPRECVACGKLPLDLKSSYGVQGSRVFHHAARQLSTLYSAVYAARAFNSTTNDGQILGLGSIVLLGIYTKQYHGALCV